jgi:hypothetical protein
MEFTYNAYAIFLLICGAVLLILANYIFKRGGNAVKWFSYMMISNAIWSIAYGLELASGSLWQIKFLIDIEYIGIASLPLNWFLFCLHFCGKECWYKKPKNLILLLIMPIAAIVLVWTNDFHYLYYENITLATEGPFPMANITFGLFYKIFTIYFYLLLACGCYLIFYKV